ncbi:MAG TPA: thiamine pyrophosphate-dependent enzyme [Opitutaceae bacterium]|nr:thiamine pyrophosphate-dependent enzyme [Opitutaceae bacterium]
MFTLTRPTAPEAPVCTVNKASLKADTPTWCPGCGDFAVLGAFQRVLEKLQIPQHQLVTLAGIGCSSRLPYFVNTHGGHFIHGRALAFASGVSLGRDDLHVVVFGGDGDGFSIGGNHLDHTARKNVKMTYVIMDNSVYGLTKKQTSPTSPVGFKSKSDPTGAIDPAINPMRRLLGTGATFVARAYVGQLQHMTDLIERAMKHDGFSVVEVLTHCAEFYENAFDGMNPRKGGKFETIDEKAHDVTDLNAAFKLASLPSPGVFGVYYETHEPTKNAREAALMQRAQEVTKGADGLTLLQAAFNRMK